MQATAQARAPSPHCSPHYRTQYRSLQRKISNQALPRRQAPAQRAVRPNVPARYLPRVMQEEERGDVGGDSADAVERHRQVRLNLRYNLPIPKLRHLRELRPQRRGCQRKHGRRSPLSTPRELQKGLSCWQLVFRDRAKAPGSSATLSNHFPAIWFVP